MARLQGVLGHAFQFDMKEGGQHVNHDHLDWGPAVDILPRIAQFQTFMADENDQGVNFPALKQEAKAAVVNALERGAPTLVWSPMSQAMSESHHHGVCWGLIVGYTESEETYTIRHPFVEGTYSVRYDEVGQSEAIESMYMHVYVRPSTADERTTHRRRALRTAVAIAHSTRYAADDARNANRRAMPHGFARLRSLAQSVRVGGCPRKYHPPSPRDAHVAAGCRRDVSAGTCRFLPRCR